MRNRLPESPKTTGKTSSPDAKQVDQTTTDQPRDIWIGDRVPVDAWGAGGEHG